MHIILALGIASRKDRMFPAERGSCNYLIQLHSPNEKTED